MSVPQEKSDDLRTWAMAVHFSQLAGFVIPFVGLIAPIILWQVKRADLPELDPHGKAVTNWVLSLALYGLVGYSLLFGLFAFISIPLLFLLTVMGFIFPVIGGIKAGSGKVWKYPLSIPFIK